MKPANHQWTRAVVLTAPPPNSGAPDSSLTGGRLDGPLKAMFAARDWFAIERHDPYVAMAELCLRERAQLARAAWGLQPMEKIALVIVESDYWARQSQEVGDLVAAVKQYIPGATIWTANGEAITPMPGTPLASVAPPPTTRHKPPASTSTPKPPVQQHSADQGAAPMLKLAGDAELPADLPADSKARMADSDAQGARSGATPAESRRLTRQEIDMLLQQDSGPNMAGGEP